MVALCKDFIYTVFVRCGSKPAVAAGKNHICVLLNINGNFLAGGQVVCIKEHNLFDKLSFLVGKEVLFVIVHALLICVSAIDSLDCAYNIAVRIVNLGEILWEIAEVAAQLRNNRLVVAEVLAYSVLKRDKIAVIAVYKLLEGLCVLLIFNKGFVHRNKGVLIESVVEIIVLELLEICLCFGKVLFAPFRNKCVGVVRRSNVYGGKVAYHKSVIGADCGNTVNTCKSRLVVFVVHNRNGVIARLCKYIVDCSLCVCGKYGLFPVLRNYVFLGRLADKESKTLRIQLFVKVGGIGGFCVCLNGNAFADLCVLGYGGDADKTDAVFNTLGLQLSSVIPSGCVISAACLAADKLRSNTGDYNLISVMELIFADIAVAALSVKVAACDINAVDKQRIDRFPHKTIVPLVKAFLYLRCAGGKGIKGSSAEVDRIHNGGFAGFKAHCGVVTAVGARSCNAVTELHIFNVLKAYGYVNRTYKLAEFLRKSLHMLLEALEHIPFAGCAVFFVEHEVNIGFKVVPRGDKCLP